MKKFRRLFVITGIIFFSQFIKAQDSTKVSREIQQPDSLIIRHYVDIRNQSKAIINQRRSWFFTAYFNDSQLMDYIESKGKNNIPEYHTNLFREFVNDSAASSEIPDTMFTMLTQMNTYFSLIPPKELSKGIRESFDNYFWIDSIGGMPASEFKRTVNILLKDLYQDTSYIKVQNVQREYALMPFGDHVNYNKRFWLKNSFGDSVGVWMNSKNTNELTIRIDPGVRQEKITKAQTRKEQLNERVIKESLKKVHVSTPKPVFWKYGGTGSFQFSQGYVSNWVQGGENNISTLTDLKGFLHYKKGKATWDNNASFKYGLLKPGEEQLRKNDDNFELSSKFGYKAFNKFFYSTEASFKSQIFKGYDYPNDSVEVSDFMNPGYFVFAIGLDYKPNDNYTVLVSPLSSKITMVSDTARIDQTKYGIETDERSRKEIGAFIKARAKVDINDDIQLNSKLDLFSNYVDKPQNIDIDWELQLSMKINYFITTNISTHMIYDDNVNIPVYENVNGEKVQTGVTKKLQFKEMLSVGFTFKF